jgi:predicted nucleotidyltransferase
MPIQERAYLQANWPLLAGLREALRTEPSVRAAILFGSYARGDQHLLSDVDILVQAQPETPMRGIANRLRERFDMSFHLIALEDAEMAPLLLSEIVGEGRVLVDRIQLWPRLTADRGRIERAAGRERKRIDAELEATFGSSRAA